MSDFDDALERLVTDPGFARALAADPEGALAGYRLTGEERAILATQLSDQDGEQHAVEVRTNKSSFAGLLGGGLMTGGSPETDVGSAPDRGFGSAPESQRGFGAASPVQRGFGAAPPVERGFGAAAEPPSSQQVGFGPAGPAEPYGDPAPDGPVPRLPDGYQTRVDVDGDGTWDEHRLRASRDGGVQIEADLDRDGRIDFVGHDTDADGLVEWSAYDTDGDGTLETRRYDDDGDGWMDRTKAP